jgi:hypothetical protein
MITGMFKRVLIGRALVVLLMSPFESQTESAAATETHALRVRGSVKYRCYAGYDGKKIVDERTGKPCDNKEYQSQIVDKAVTLQIKDEPDPKDSRDLAGAWSEDFDFKGRKFSIAITLFKDASSKTYQMRMVARDDEPTPRQTAVFSRMKSVNAMNTISVECSSAGKKEEISFEVTVEPEPQR